MNLLKFTLLLFAVLQVLSTSSQTMWCPKSGISGFEDEAHQAKAVLSSNTSDMQEMEVFVTVQRDKLYIQSNYMPEGADYPFKISTNEEEYNMKNWLKFLINPEEAQGYNSAFNNAYRNNMVLKIDASVLSHPHYKNLVWGDAKNVNIVNGTQIFETEILPYTKNLTVRVHDHVYIELETEKACEIADQLSKVKEITDKLYQANNEELKQDEISTTSNDKQVQSAVKQNTFGEFFNSIISSGLTLVNLGCEPIETTIDLVFDAYKEEEKVGQIKIHFVNEAAPSNVVADNNAVTSDTSVSITDNSSSTTDTDSSSSTGLGKAWYFIVGIIVFLGIRAIAKSS